MNLLEDEEVNMTEKPSLMKAIAVKLVMAFSVVPKWLMSIILFFLIWGISSFTTNVVDWSIEYPWLGITLGTITLTLTIFIIIKKYGNRRRKRKSKKA